MFRLAKWLFCVVALAGAVMLGTASPARADLLVQLQETGVNGGAFTTVIDVPSGTSGNAASPLVYGDFTITQLSAGSNSPGTSSLAQLLSANLNIQNTGSATATLNIRISDVNFSLPGSNGSNLILTSHVGGSADNGGIGTPNSADSLTFQSYADNSNTQFGTSGATPGAQTPNLSSGSYSSDASTAFARTTNLYSVTETFQIKLVSGDEIGFSARTNLAVPAPASMMAAFTAVPFLGLGAWLRRRKLAI